MQPDIDLEQIETKLAAARTKLILDKPFLGALVLRLPMKATDGEWCPTTATDAKRFYYNPVYINSLSLSQTQFMLAHEALHCALSHFSRRQHRVKQRWDLACDFAINPLLIDDGLTPPPNAQIMPQYLGMTAEEIYPLIEQNENTETLDEHLYDKEQNSQGSQDTQPPKKTDNDNGKQGKSPIMDEEDKKQGEQGNQQGDENDPQQETGSSAQLDDSKDSDSQDDSAPPEPLTEDEKQTLNTQWQQRMAGAAQQAMQAGKLGGTIARIIDHLLQPQLPWRMLLARYISYTARDDFSYMRPARRESDAIMPSLRSSQVNIVVAIDTSGSIKSKEIEQFLSEVTALKAQIRAKVSVLACDATICPDAPWHFEPWEPIELSHSLAGGGGTDFCPVFDWIEQAGNKPDLLIYFTDADGKFPDQAPDYAVLWLVKGKQKVPWGQRILLN